MSLTSLLASCHIFSIKLSIMTFCILTCCASCEVSAMFIVLQYFWFIPSSICQLCSLPCRTLQNLSTCCLHFCLGTGHCCATSVTVFFPQASGTPKLWHFRAQKHINRTEMNKRIDLSILIKIQSDWHAPLFQTTIHLLHELARGLRKVCKHLRLPELRMQYILYITSMINPW